VTLIASLLTVVVQLSLELIMTSLQETLLEHPLVLPLCFFRVLVCV